MSPAVGLPLVFLLLAEAATAQTTGSCLANGQACQWDTSLGDCCSTYCYQQVGQQIGVCKDRPASTTGTTGGATAQQAYQTPQRNPATYTQNGQTGSYGGGQMTAGSTGQCLQNGQSCQWDTSMGNCCSTYCYQQVGQTTGICQDRSSASSGGTSSYQSVQYNPSTYSQPAAAYSNAYSGSPQAAQSSYSGQAYTAGTQEGQGGCQANGQTCTWSGSMGNCCSGWCQQLEQQPTGTCAQPAGTPGPSSGYPPGSGQAVYQGSPQYSAPTNAQPQQLVQSPSAYSTSYSPSYSPGQTYSGSPQASQTLGSGQGCLQTGTSCTWSGSTGNCCSGWCKQMETEATGTCSEKIYSQG